MNSFPERQIIIEERVYVLRFVPAENGEVERVSAWRQGREVHTIDVDGFLKAAPADRTGRMRAINEAFTMLEMQVRYLKA